VYVTILFPVASETFATQDIRVLAEKGVQLEVHSLRPPVGGEAELAHQRQVEAIHRTYNSLGATVRGLGSLLTHPRYLLEAIRILRVVSKGTRGQLLRTLALLPRAFELLIRLKKDPPDVVHLYWGHYPTMVGRLVSRFLPQTGISMSLVAYDIDYNYPLTSSVARSAGFVRTNAQVNLGDIERLTGLREDRIKVVFDGVDLARLPADPRSAERVPGRIVTPARLVREKGVDDVLHAFAIILAERRDASLELLGDGPDRARLEKLAIELGIADRVVFRGHVPHEEVFLSLTRAELLLFLSHSERLPNVVKEAMGCGATCVSTATVGIDELLASPERGVVVPIGKPAVAAEAVLELLGPSPRALLMREAARRFVFDSLDLDATTDAYVEAWTRMVSESRAAASS